MPGKILLRLLLCLLLLTVAAVVVLYIQASRVPSRYSPARLTRDQKVQAAKEFVSLITDFSNKSQANEAFDWEITQDQLNDSLASMDEIASNRPGGKSGEVTGMMESVGLCDPAVALDEGQLTLLVRSREYGKVVSADLALSLTPDKRLAIRLVRTRVGRLSIPDSLIRGPLGQLKDLLRRKLPSGSDAAGAPGQSGPRRGNGASQPSAEEVGAVLGAIIQAIDAEPIVPEMVGGIGNKRVRVEGIDIHPGLLKLHVVPVGRARTAE